MRVAIVLLGFGNVGRRFVTLLDESRDALRASGVEPVIVGVATGRHGRVFEVAGLDTALIDPALAAGDAGEPASVPFLASALDRLRAEAGHVFGARVVVETTPLDVRSGEPAMTHIRTAFAGGAHVISANKGPVAFAHRALAAEARAAGVSFLFEGAVMDGVPVFNLVRETLPVCTINGFRGVVNSTTNFLITAMENGEPFGPALKRMQDEGVAEADPSLDVDGWDAAAKGAALANVLLDADLTPRDVAREGVSAATADRALAALAAGRKLKVVASGHGRGANARVRVSLEELPANDPLAIVDGQANALELDTWPMGRLVITQRDGGLEKTAYALVTDLVTIVRRLQHEMRV